MIDWESLGGTRLAIDHLFDLSSDVAVVTGAGRGIGEGIARTLAGAGAAVVCAARRGAEIERVAAAIRDDGGRALAIPTDVTDDAAVEALAKGAIDAFGGLDIWVNNAGGSPIQAPLLELPREEWDATLSLNLTAIWVCTRKSNGWKMFGSSLKESPVNFVPHHGQSSIGMGDGLPLLFFRKRCVLQ